MKKVLITLILVLNLVTTSYAQLIHAFFLCDMKTDKDGITRPVLPASVEFWQVWGIDKTTKKSIVYVLIRNHRKVVKCAEEECTYEDDKNTQLLLKDPSCLAYGKTIKGAIKQFYSGENNTLAKKVVKTTIANPDYDEKNPDSPKTIEVTAEKAEALTSSVIKVDIVKPISVLLGQRY